jgi:glycosyltransferase involved in cell wall biosynthesis
MATGTVPIIVNHGASPEIVGDCGIYARISDYLDTVIGKIALVNVNDLADKIIWAVQNPDELRKLAAKGLARAKLFSWQTAADRLGELLAR